MRWPSMEPISSVECGGSSTRRRGASPSHATGAGWSTKACTCGRTRWATSLAWPQAEVRFTIDARYPDAGKHEQLMAHIGEASRTVAAARGLGLQMDRLTFQPPP